MNTIANVAESGLCCGCGTCAGVCPPEAIRMKVSEGVYFPEIDEERCSLCRVCVESCPGHNVDFEALCSEIFRRQPKDRSIGNYLRCYVGHSTDDAIRYSSSSGGLVTQLLIFALESNIIEGALVTRMRKGNPLEPEAFIARTAEEVISASKSKYCPVAVNVGLRQILKEKGRFAVVGLPCHIHGVRKAEQAFKPLRKRIVLHIGLLCSHMTNFFGTDCLLAKSQVKKEQVSELNYRGDGWPGFLSIKVKNRSVFSMPLLGGWNTYWPVFSSFFFTPTRCIMCPDQSSELADVSLGDAWLPELKHEKIGTSIILTRTEIGEDILALASSSRAISLTAVDIQKIRQSQAVNMTFKKADFWFRRSFLNSLGITTPRFNPEPSSRSSPLTPLRTLFIYLNIRASSLKSFKSFMVNIPFPVFRLYYGVYKYLSKA